MYKHFHRFYGLVFLATFVYIRNIITDFEIDTYIKFIKSIKLKWIYYKICVYKLYTKVTCVYKYCVPIHQCCACMQVLNQDENGQEKAMPRSCDHSSHLNYDFHSSNSKFQDENNER